MQLPDRLDRTLALPPHVALTVATVPVADANDSRSPAAIAGKWASRVMTVSLEMVVPGLAGLWIDSKLGTKVVFGVIGFAVGMSSAIWHLLRMTSHRRRPTEATSETEGTSGR